MWFTDNAAAEDKDLRGDHEQLCYVIKDMYHSMAIVRRATDPTHPLAGRLLTDNQSAHDDQHDYPINYVIMPSVTAPFSGFSHVDVVGIICLLWVIW